MTTPVWEWTLFDWIGRAIRCAFRVPYATLVGAVRAYAHAFKLDLPGAVDAMAESLVWAFAPLGGGR